MTAKGLNDTTRQALTTPSLLQKDSEIYWHQGLWAMIQNAENRDTIEESL
jgi:hypothetical protein